MRIVLAPGHASPQMIPVQKVTGGGITGMTALFLYRGEEHPVVPDDSPATGVSETLAQSLVERGLCQYVGDQDERDEQPEAADPSVSLVALGSAEETPATIADSSDSGDTNITNITDTTKSIESHDAQQSEQSESNGSDGSVGA